MTGFFEALGVFFSGASLLVYICIFLGKILEVSLGTLRIVLINRGERLIGAAIALVEITLWLVIAGSVLADYQSDPFKMFAYAFAYAIGNFLGSWLEEKLAFGLCSVQAVIIDKETSERMCQQLRAGGFGVTELSTQGRDGSEHFMLLANMRRKLSQEAIAIMQLVDPNVVITVADVKSQRGGYLRQSPMNRRKKSK